VRIVISDSTDVYRNLAIEEWLLDHASEGAPILFICVNSPCVVIGKNQNPWRECRLSDMKTDGITLARRISGGGAVYHDEGNLNFGIVVPRTEYREEKQYACIVRALERFGIQASMLGKTSMAINGLKFSGQAFCFRGESVLHHGTLLVNSDLNRLRRYLGPELEGIETRAVASVPADVANLTDFAPALTISALSDAVIESFRTMYGGGRDDRWSASQIPEQEMDSIRERISATDWIFGCTPRFQVTVKGQRIEVEKGRFPPEP